MPAATSTAHRVIRAVLVRHLHAEGVSPNELAKTFAVTPTYIRKILDGSPRTKPTADEKAIEKAAAAHKGLLLRQGYGFFFR